MIYESKRFKVDVEVLPEDKLPQYVIRNKGTEVVEFAHNILYYALSWVDQFEDLMDKREQGQIMEAHANIPTAGSLN